jgi:hypothetical protein
MPKKSTPKQNASVETEDSIEIPVTKKTDRSLEIPTANKKSEPPRPDPVAEVTPTVVISQKAKAKTISNKRLGWLIGSGAAALILVAGLGWWFFRPTDQTNDNSNLVTNDQTGELVARQLDGVLVEPEKANTNILAVMIENINESRPPSALDKASVVYEALAEGGITRFLALYPIGVSFAELGPVRSARPYYISWAEEYRALYVHAGGSPQALTYLRSGQAKVIDFNQFVNGGHFWRDKTRVAPHNLYTDSDKLYLGLKRAAPDASPTFSSWTFQTEPTLEQRPVQVPDTTIDFSSFNYKVTYQYDREQNRYQRLVGEKPHLTRDGQQIYAKNIIVQYTKTGLIANDSQRLQMETSGEGRAVIIRDGTVIEGTWKKPSASERTQWFDTSGQTIPLNRGPIWIEIVPPDRVVKTT